MSKTTTFPAAHSVADGPPVLRRCNGSVILVAAGRL